MSELTIITNNVPRQTIDAWELTEKERKEFDYLDWSKIEKGEDSATFVRYKGELYDLGDFMQCPDGLFNPGDWHAYISDTFFSGILVKFVSYRHDDADVIMGRYYS